MVLAIFSARGQLPKTYFIFEISVSEGNIGVLRQPSSK
jgi:hypothetical protein